MKQLQFEGSLMNSLMQKLTVKLIKPTFNRDAAEPTCGQISTCVSIQY